MNSKKKKLYYFPSEPITGYQNPYCNYAKEALQKYYYVYDMKKGSKVKRMFTLLYYSTKADVIIFNWLESLPFFACGKIQFLFALIALKIIKYRKVKVLFMFHDLISHFGDNWMSRYLMDWQFKNSNLIISHSKEAAKIAKEKTTVPSYFYTHPIPTPSIKEIDVPHDVDVFIWGQLFSYKGVYEFISLPEIQHSNIKIYILGGTTDANLRKQIKSACNNHITYEERRANFDEIGAYCKKSKYVLFPYIGESVSSSGALIDTIVFGGTPIGPNRGAFKDLNEEGVCLVYNDYNELLLLLSNKEILEKDKRLEFIKKYSWDSFATFVYNHLT
jgi:hypothetical protein